MSDPIDNRQDRLAEAIDIYLRHDEASETDPSAELLGQNETLREFLEPLLRPEDAAAPTPPAESSDLSPGRVLGDYRIGTEIGRGGMGAVFEAEQISLQRSVALKVLLPHLTIGPNQIARFRAEAANAARLRHPSIVPIHEVSEVAGVHFFAMELVRGERLDRYVTTQSIGVSQARRIALIVELVAQVADALEYAHQHGIIHRDVKPHNILVAEQRARLLDFGLSKLIHAESGTRSGNFVGTPHYVSPEQAIGSTRRIGPHSDVFSLGVVLYELLAGKRPFAGESPEDVLQSVLRDEPIRLRATDPTIPRDLETICARAIEKNISDRYATALDMATDLRAFLRHEPIRARPVGWLGRIARFAQRRPSVMTSIALSGLIMVATPIAFAWHRSECDYQALETRESDRIAFYALTNWIEALDGKVMRSMTIDADDRSELDGAAEHCVRFMSRGENDVARVCGATLWMARVAKIYMMLGEFDAAVAVNERALVELRTRLVGVAPTRATVYQEAYLMSQRVRLTQNHDGDLERIQADFVAAVELFERAASLSEGEPTDSELEELVRLHIARGEILTHRRGKAQQALDLITRAIELDQQLSDEVRWTPGATLRRAICLNARATLLTKCGHPAAATRDLDALDAVLETLDPEDPDVRLQHVERDNTRATIDARAGNREQAIASLEAAVIALDKLVREFPGQRRYIGMLAMTESQLGRIQIEIGHWREGRQSLEQARSHARTIIDATDDPRAARRERSVLAHACSTLGTVMLSEAYIDPELRPPLQAADLFREAEEIQSKLTELNRENIEYHAILAHTRCQLSQFEVDYGDPNRAFDYARRAIHTLQRAIDGNPDNPAFRVQLGSYIAQLAVTLAALGKHDEAIEQARRAHEFGPDNRVIITTAAEALARSVPWIENDQSLASDTRDVRIETTARELFEWLSRIVNRYPKAVGWLIAEPHFDPFRTHDDYETLFAATQRSR